MGGVMVMAQVWRRGSGAGIAVPAGDGPAAARRVRRGGPGRAGGGRGTGIEDAGLDGGQRRGGIAAAGVVADGVQGRGEGDPARVQARAGGRGANHDTDGLVDHEESPQFLADAGGVAGPQHGARAAQVGLEFCERGLDSPPAGVNGGQLRSRRGCRVEQGGRSR